MIDVNLAALPNQSLTIQLAERVYDIRTREANGAMAVTIARDGVTLVSALRMTAGTPLLPYRYQEAGNFVLTTEGDALPYYGQFGITQFLVYLTAEEVAALRGA
jgi:hypothetical protein